MIDVVSEAFDLCGHAKPGLEDNQYLADPPKQEAETVGMPG
jgi:hypothetical protein